ncbi:adenosylcobinamide-GDP ribazoletransferase [Tindallia californiensis]|uniref:Adenosylcobinamide-GDP ribazoletransferase n=1 Tax=Tindallia californiensis TaxID=159292 RepID=A0A1H3I9P9_9FIRM|nr:adenosylcobinamide-GDP ribazoletransferase [Tindallia californiensis]SDY24456.1 cobalamin-5'-phosphate synthase [Tindallia californiensis]
MKHIMQAITFLTTLPFTDHTEWKDSDYKNMAFFPLAGMAIGGLLCLTDWLLYPYLSTSVLAVILLSINFLLTGGIHIDGLADTADGYFSGKKKKDILEIMKDSRLGTHGVVCIILVCLMKFTLLVAIPASIRLWTIFLMPIFGRLSLVLGAYRSTYARESGLGHFYIGRITVKEVAIAMVISLSMVCFLPIAGSFLAPLWMITILFKRLLEKKIGGMTGDTLGALLELTETLFLLWIVVIFGGR